MGSARIDGAMGHDPVVFISSTSEDLREHREQAAKAARASGFSPRMMEYFPASGSKPSLGACLDMVEEAEVVVVLVAHRYGWVPEDASNSEGKSITWLECSHAWTRGKEVLAFLVDPEFEWPDRLREEYRLIGGRKLAAREFDQLREEVQRNEERLAEFKKQLNGYFRSQFTDAASVRPLVSEALAQWRLKHHSAAAAARDPDPYLQALEADARKIRITSLATKRSEPYVFDVDEIYIPLSTVAIRDESAPREEQEHRVVLQQAMSQRKVVIVGDPGSGKSTF